MKSYLNTGPRQVELPPGQHVAVLLPRQFNVVRDFFEAPRPQADGLPDIVGPWSKIKSPTNFRTLFQGTQVQIRRNNPLHDGDQDLERQTGDMGCLKCHQQIFKKPSKEESTRFTALYGSPCELGSQGNGKVYRSLFSNTIAGTKFTNLSLQILPRKEDGKKTFKLYIIFNPMIIFSFVQQLNAL